MAPHVHRLSAYASQRLVSLFDMLSRKYVTLLLALIIFHSQFWNIVRCGLKWDQIFAS